MTTVAAISPPVASISGIISSSEAPLVDDVVTSGASLLEMIPLIEATGGEIAATVVIVDRSGKLHELVSPATGHTYHAAALWSLNLPTYEPGTATCPGCFA